MQIQNIDVYLYQQKQIDMKNFKVTYKRENGTIDFEVVTCKTVKLTKTINNYFNNINAEILSIYEQL